MHGERYLAHSSGPWKKHKYFKKIGEGANAIYKYHVTGEGYKEDEQKARDSLQTAINAEAQDRAKQKKAQEEADYQNSESKWHYELGEDEDRRGYYFDKEAGNIGGTSVKNLKESLQSDAKKAHDNASELYRISEQEYRKSKKAQTDASHYSKSASANAHKAEQMKNRADKAVNDYKTKSLKGITESVMDKAKKRMEKAKKSLKHDDFDYFVDVDRILKNNRDIMVKDLSDEQIQMGRDYITMMKATGIGTILAGPIGGVFAGTASRAINKMADNERKVYAQERDREAQYKAEQKINSENAERAKNFDKYVDEHGGKLTTENLPSHDREGKPTYMLTEKQKQKYVDEYNNKRNSFKTDEDKDLWEAQQNAPSKKEKDKIIDDRVKLAKKTNQYEMEFLERNLDVDDETGEQLKGKAMDDAYRKYLQEEKNYYR